MSHIYQPTDVVLAKVKGYPAWPAMVVPSELIPENVLRTRHQQTSKRKSAAEEELINGDGAQEEEPDDEDPENFIVYSDFLKFRKFSLPRPQYCVKFFCDDSYIWVKATDLKPLTVEKCNAWLEKPSSRNKKLIPAFEMARKGSDGIDVWEFIEYGSAGKPDEEDYVQSQEEEEDEGEEEEQEDAVDENSSEEYEEDGRKTLRPARSSARQKQKRESQASRNKRATRSRKQEDQLDDEPLGSDDEIVAPKAKRAKVKSKSKAKPLVPRYKYDDDEDWTLVGRGPQYLSVQKNISTFANKLSQKRNLDVHVETKLDLVDRLHGINKLLLETFASSGRKDTSLKGDYEVILDELSVALSTRGFHDEFVTVFQSSNELLSYFRLLFNMKGEHLRQWDLWNQFQDDFQSIYNYKFIPDQEVWSKERVLKKEPLRGNLQEVAIEDRGQTSAD